MAQYTARDGSVWNDAAAYIAHLEAKEAARQPKAAVYRYAVSRKDRNTGAITQVPSLVVKRGSDMEFLDRSGNDSADYVALKLRIQQRADAMIAALEASSKTPINELPVYVKKADRVAEDKATVAAPALTPEQQAAIDALENLNKAS